MHVKILLHFRTAIALLYHFIGIGVFAICFRFYSLPNRSSMIQAQAREYKRILSDGLQACLPAAGIAHH